MTGTVPKVTLPPHWTTTKALDTSKSYPEFPKSTLFKDDEPKQHFSYKVY